MAINIGLIGAKGRLGTSIVQLAKNHPQFVIAQQFGRGDDLTMGDCDLYLDVSSAAAMMQNLQVALQKNKPLVVGTTGLSDEDMAALENGAKQIPIFYAPNFSIGMAIMAKLAAKTATLFDPTAEIELIETHHIHKKDAPSGGAKSLAKEVTQNHPQQKKPMIHSLRMGEIIGKHELQFNTPFEQLTLIHTALTRDLFAKGALMAARFLSTQTPALYTMKHLVP